MSKEKKDRAAGLPRIMLAGTKSGCGTGLFLGCKLFKLSDTGKLTFVGIIDNGYRLEGCLVVVLKDHVEAAIGQRAVNKVKELVRRTGINADTFKGTAVKLHRSGFGIQAQMKLCVASESNRDVRMVKKIFEKRGKAVLRGHLDGILKISVIVGENNGDSVDDTGIQRLNRRSPLLCSVVFEDIVKNKAPKLRKLGIRSGNKLGNGDFFTPGKDGGKLSFQRFRLFRGEKCINGLKIKGNGHKLVPDAAKNTMFIEKPVGKRFDIGKCLFGIGVKNVRSVAMYKDAVFVLLIIHISRNMAALIQNTHAQTVLFREYPGTNGAGETAANNKSIKFHDHIPP